MSDKELLELAAKAAGMDFQFCIDTGRPAVADSHGGGSFWNPLENDADALRLAVKLAIDIRLFMSQGWRPYSDPEHYVQTLVDRLGKGCNEAVKDDPYAATRRVIVRAAAEIGKAQQ